MDAGFLRFFVVFFFIVPKFILLRKLLGGAEGGYLWFLLAFGIVCTVHSALECVDRGNLGRASFHLGNCPDGH